MSLRQVRVPESLLLKPLPRRIARFLAFAESRIDAYRLRVIKEKRSSPFIPSDYTAVYQWLRAIARRGLATGDAFLEWGSGFGVIACLACMLEFEAFGIESEPELVDQAEELAEDRSLDVSFACGSFIPRGEKNWSMTLTMCNAWTWRLSPPMTNWIAIRETSM